MRPCASPPKIGHTSAAQLDDTVDNIEAVLRAAPGDSSAAGARLAGASPSPT